MDLDTACQCSHWGWAAYLTVTFYLGGCRLRWAMAACLALIVVKEFAIDPITEGEGIILGLWDTLFSVAGLLTGAATVLLLRFFAFSRR